MATVNSATYAGKQPGTSEGIAKTSLRLHDTVSVPATLATNDIVNWGYLPVNAIVSSVTLKAATQLDSNGSPTLTFDVGYAASGTFAVSAQAFMAASALVGRASGTSFDTTMVAAGKFLKNTSGAPLLITSTCHAGPATGVAGTLELEVAYWIEEPGGSQA